MRFETGTKNGDKRAISKSTPAWIVMDPATRLMSVHPHRAKVLQEIYDLYERGWGLPRIVQMLNQRKEGSWAYGKKDTGAGWNTAYLHKLLTNRAVMGEYEPMSRTHGGINETSKGIRVLDYYPKVIEADQFNRVTAIREAKRRTGGRTSYRLFNLFASMMNCAECGTTMYYQSQQRAGRKTNHKLKDGSLSTQPERHTRAKMGITGSRGESPAFSLSHKYMGETRTEAQTASRDWPRQQARHAGLPHGSGQGRVV